MPRPIQMVLDQITTEMQSRDDRGNVADYIPELARIDPNQFAISVNFASGQTYEAGDVSVGFSAQSITKVFTLAIALGRSGDQIWHRVGREPSGNAFNSIVQLENENGRPRNPFVNAGAIVTTDEVLAGRAPKQALAEILGFVRAAAGDNDIHINDEVARSEQGHGHRNFALAHFFGRA